jgi:hypothetical protein
MKSFGIRSKKRQSQINDGAISQIMKMHDNSKLKSKERLFEPKDLATKFAMWFVVNWEWHEDNDKGAKYLSIYDGKTIMHISEIYDNWLINDI